MAKRNRLWAIVVCGYVLASFLLLLVYENYVRNHVIGTAGIATNSAASVQSLNSLQQEQHPRRTQNQVQERETRQREETHDQDANSLEDPESALAELKPRNDAFPNSHRLHTCKLPGGETLHTMQAPDLIIAGAQKGGTSAFYFILKRHPHFSASMKFESHFFDWHFAVPPKDLNNPTFWKKFNATNEDELLCAARKQYIDENFRVDKIARASKLKLTYEKTPNYMFLPQVPELIYKVCPWHPKIILILRNPVDRAYSHYVMNAAHRFNLSFEEYIELELETLRKEGLTNIPNIPASEWGSLDDSLDHLFNNPPNHMTQEEADHANWMVYRTRHMCNYMQRGIYGVQLERWMKFFPLNQKLLVINNERLQREPREVLEEALHFLDAPKPDYFSDESVSVATSSKEKAASSANVVSNVLSVGGYPPMKNATRHFLEKFYAPYNNQLADILGEEWRGVWEYTSSSSSTK